MDNNLPFVSTYNWYLKNLTPNTQCKPYKYTLTEVNYNAPSGFSPTEILYTSDTQLFMFNWDKTTTVGTADSPKAL